MRRITPYYSIQSRYCHIKVKLLYQFIILWFIKLDHLQNESLASADICKMHRTELAFTENRVNRHDKRAWSLSVTIGTRIDRLSIPI